MHLGEVRVWLRVQNGTVAAHYAVLFEHSHLVDDTTLHTVGRLQDFTVYLVLHVHCAFRGAAEDEMRCILGFGTYLCLSY